MNYLGSDASVMIDQASDTITAGGAAATGIAASIKQWETVLATATDALTIAKARLELAKLGLSQAQIDAVARGRVLWYYGGIGLGVLLLAVVTYKTMRKR